MRSHGVPNLPDPQPGTSNAKFPGAQQLGVGSSQLSAAENACRHLLPAGIDDRFPPAEVQLLLPGMRRFSQCMRSDGVPNWLDTVGRSQGTIVGRWYRCATNPVPMLKKVKLAQVRDHLPLETPHVSAEARAAYESAIQNAPDSQTAKRIRKKLTQLTALLPQVVR